MRRKIVIDRSERLHQIPSSLFVDLKRKAQRAVERGVDVIDLTAVNPAEPPPPEAIESLCRSAGRPESHRYRLESKASAAGQGTAAWFESRFGVSLQPDVEILPLQGARQALVGLPLAFVNPDDVVLLPDPCYPIYRTGAILAGARVETMPLLERNDFLPNLKRIPDETARRAKLMFLNYPNNPTTAVADLSFFSEVAEWARLHNVAVIHDAAYLLMPSGDDQESSFLQVRGAKSLSVEIFSLSISHRLGGWRIGFAVGNRQLLAGISAVAGGRSALPPPALQQAALAALKALDGGEGERTDRYASRRELVIGGLRQAGLKVRRTRGLPFLWMAVPGRYTSLGFTRRLFRRTGVLMTPGSGFGERGEGYVRISLTISRERLQEAVRRIGRQKALWQRTRRRPERSPGTRSRN
jgi:LL-diaminopimelate aminotransferase